MWRLAWPQSNAKKCSLIYRTSYMLRFPWIYLCPLIHLRDFRCKYCLICPKIIFFWWMHMYCIDSLYRWILECRHWHIVYNICFKFNSIFTFFGLSEGFSQSSGEAPEYKLVPLRGFSLISGIHSPEVVDQIQNFEIQDSDVFVITYPKSGKTENHWSHMLLLKVQYAKSICRTCITSLLFLAEKIVTYFMKLYLCWLKLRQYKQAKKITVAIIFLS